MTPPISPRLDVNTDRLYRRSLVQLIRQWRLKTKTFGIMTGVEVGVACGVTSKLLLESFSNLTLWMVDHWGLAATDRRSTLADHLQRMYEAERQTEFAAERRIIRRMKYVQATEEFPGQADWVFIDAKMDWENWWGRVRSGGLCCGHTVNRTVERFFKRNELTLNVDENASIWWGVKP